MVVTNEDLHDDIIREAMEKAPSGFCHWCPSFIDSKLGEQEHAFLVAQIKVLDDRISSLEIEARTSSHSKNLIEWNMGR